MSTSVSDFNRWPRSEAGAYPGTIGTPEGREVLASGGLMPRGFVEWFVVAQTAIPALLYLPGSQAFRLPVRIGAYATALVGFGVWWLATGRHRTYRHPAEPWLVLAALCLSAMVFHPSTSSPEAGIAQTLLYFAVLCPLFWVPGLVNHPRQLVRILALLLVCNGINSVVGVLQVYDADRWMPAQLSAVFESDIDRFMASTYMGPDGRRIVRPPGLFDTPGAVCGPGTIAALLGLLFTLERSAWWRRMSALGLGLAGVTAIYLSHVRSNFVVLVIMVTAYCGLLVVQGQRQRLMAFASLAAGLLFVGLTTATLLGGESIGQRFGTLLEEDPRQVYYDSRGQQLADGFNTLAVEYPVGAGLGRWGMMRGYFGDPANLDSSALWAELQPNAWLLDGGWLLLVFYSLALLATARYDWRLARSLVSREDRRWAAAVAAINVGTMALVFTFVPFTTQVGLQFWFLEGALHGAMARRTFT